MILKWKNLYSSLLLVAGCIVVVGPSLVSCSSDCEDRDDCAPYMPPGGSSSSGSGGDAGAPDHGGTAGTSGGGKSGGSAGGSSSEGGAGAASGGTGEGGEGGSTTPTPCDGACEAPTPVCDESDDTCVECLEEADCTGSEKKCDTTARECVECLGSEHCTTAAAAKCDGGACVECEINDDCAHIAGKGVCDGGTCVQCTVADEAPCAGKSCNPATKSCTNTTIASVGTCAPCVADSECSGGGTADPNARCVPMEFDGADRVGGFCLRRVTKSCNAPFTVTFATASLSGAASESYCGIDQANVTCEAVLDLGAGRSCSDGLDTSCGCSRDAGGACTSPGKGGLCQTVGGVAEKCTYQCATALECPGTRTCTFDDPYCH